MATLENRKICIYRHISALNLCIYKWKISCLSMYLSILLNVKQRGKKVASMQSESEGVDEKKRSRICNSFCLCMHECITWFWRSFWLIQLVTALKSSKRLCKRNVFFSLSSFIIIIIMMSVDIFVKVYVRFIFYIFASDVTMPMSLYKYVQCTTFHSRAHTHTERERKKVSTTKHLLCVI